MTSVYLLLVEPCAAVTVAMTITMVERMTPRHSVVEYQPVLTTAQQESVRCTATPAQASTWWSIQLTVRGSLTPKQKEGLTTSLTVQRNLLPAICVPLHEAESSKGGLAASVVSGGVGGPGGEPDSARELPRPQLQPPPTQATTPVATASKESVAVTRAASGISAGGGSGTYADAAGKVKPLSQRATALKPIQPLFDAPLQRPADTKHVVVWNPDAETRFKFVTPSAVQSQLGRYGVAAKRLEAASYHSTAAFWCFEWQPLLHRLGATRNTEIAALQLDGVLTLQVKTRTLAVRDLDCFVVAEVSGPRAGEPLGTPSAADRSSCESNRPTGLLDGSIWKAVFDQLDVLAVAVKSLKRGQHIVACDSSVAAKALRQPVGWIPIGGGSMIRFAAQEECDPFSVLCVRASAVDVPAFKPYDPVFRPLVDRPGCHQPGMVEAVVAKHQYRVRWSFPESAEFEVLPGDQIFKLEPGQRFVQGRSSDTDINLNTLHRQRCNPGSRCNNKARCKYWHSADEMAGEQTASCPFKFRCTRRRQCRQQHSEEEVRFFDAHEDTFRAKVDPCRFPMCEDITGCLGAHNETDSYCVYCAAWGHLFGLCAAYERDHQFFES